MENDFQIKLSAIVDLTSIDTQIQNHFDKKKFKINLETNISSGSNVSAGAKISSESFDKTTLSIDNLSTKLQQLAMQGKITDAQFEDFGATLFSIETAFAKTGNIKEYSKNLNDLKNNITLTTTELEELNKEKQKEKQIDAENKAAEGRQNKRLIQAEQSYKNLAQSLENSYTNGKLTTKQFTELSAKAKENYDAYVKNANAISAVVDNEGQLISLNRDFKNTTADIKRSVSGLTAEYEKHSQDLDKILVKYLRWYLLAGAVSAVQGAIKKVIANVKEMDAALVELNKVADLTTSQMQSIKKEAFEIGNNVGKTATQVIGAATEFKRAGYTMRESMDLAETALIMTNVAEGITDAGQAAEYLVSILKGAKLPISEATHLLDALNEISNTQAVSFDNLADMTQRAAGTMNTLGNSVEETMALITGAYEVLQDERVAKGISVIGLRIAGLNEDLEEEAGLQSNVNKALEKYAGISIFDSTMQLRSTYDILQDLAAVWDDLNVNVQTYLTTTIAGKNRADVLAAALSNWENVEKSLNSAMDSTGSALQEQQRYLDSIEGKQQALANAWQKLADDTLSSDFVKRIYDAATFMVNLIDATGGLVPVLTNVIGLIMIFKSEVISKSIINSIESIRIGFKKAARSEEELAEATQKLRGNIATLGTAIAAITVVFQVISGVVTAIKNAQKAQEEAIQSALDKTEENIEKLDNLKKEYISLYSKTSKTAEEEKKLLDIQSSLVKNYGDLKKGIDGVNGSYEDYLGLIDEASLKEQKRQLSLMESSYAAAKANIASGGGKDGSWDYYTQKAWAVEVNFVQQIAGFLGGLLGGIYEAPGYYAQFSIESLRKRQEELMQKQLSTALSGGEIAELSEISAYLSEIDAALSADYETVKKYEELREKIEKREEKQKLYETEYGQELKRTETYLTTLLGKVEDRISQMEEENEALQKQKDLEEKLKNVEQARLELAQARNKQLRVFRAGRGFVYEVDESEVQSAQENLTKALEELSEYKYEQALENAKSFAAQLSDTLMTGDITESWGEMLDNLGEILDEDLANYIGQMKGFVSEFNGLIDSIGGGNKISTGSGINGYASGTNYATGGLSLVGEEGPELVNLPMGAKVHTASETRSVLSGLQSLNNGSNTVFNVGTVEITEPNNFDGFVSQFCTKLNVPNPIKLST